MLGDVLVKSRQAKTKVNEASIAAKPGQPEPGKHHAIIRAGYNTITHFFMGRIKSEGGCSGLAGFVLMSKLMPPV